MTSSTGTQSAKSFRDTIWDRRELRRLARQLAELAVAELTRTGGPVRDPECTRKAREAIEMAEGGAGTVAIARKIAEGSLHLSHRRYLAQQAAPLPLAALAETLISALNNSVAVWEMSPVGTDIDRHLISRFKTMFHLPKDANGTLVPGGAFANLTSLLAARAALAPRAWRKGGARVAVIAGEQSHYSISRAAGISGLGTESVFTVPLDASFRTDTSRVPEAFAAARRRGFRKFILVATSGSTATGAFDDLPAMTAEARRNGAWLHVDAAHGGGLMLSRAYRHLLKGVEDADSLAFDPHKMLFMPIAAGTVLVRDGRALRNAFQQQASYLFSKTRERQDIGPLTIACSQRFDSLKVWLALNAYPAEAWDELITHVCLLARSAYEYCLDSSILEPAHVPQANIFCLRLRRAFKSTAEADQAHWAIKERLNSSGYAYVGSTVLAGRRAIRTVLMNPRTERSDVRDVLRRIERLARQC